MYAPLASKLARLSSKDQIAEFLSYQRVDAWYVFSLFGSVMATKDEGRVTPENIQVIVREKTASVVPWM